MKKCKCGSYLIDTETAIRRGVLPQTDGHYGNLTRGAANVLVALLNAKGIIATAIKDCDDNGIECEHNHYLVITKG